MYRKPNNGQDPNLEQFEEKINDADQRKQEDADAENEDGEYGEEEQLGEEEQYLEGEADASEAQPDREEAMGSLALLQRMKSAMEMLQKELKNKNLELLECKKYNLILQQETEQLKELHKSKFGRLTDLDSTENIALFKSLKDKFVDAEKEKEKLAQAFLESTNINKQLKAILTEKDKIIEKLQADLESFLKIKGQITPILELNATMKKELGEKTKEVEALQVKLKAVQGIEKQIPEFEGFIKETQTTIETMKGMNSQLITEV